MKNSRLALRLFNAPLMLEPGKADVIVAALSEKFGLDVDVTPEVAAALTAEYREYCECEDIQGIRVIPVIGSLVHRVGGLDALSGLQSYQELGNWILDAAEDPDVKGIILDIDSGGGEVAGCFELVEMIAELRDKKPIWAAVNEHAFSAAYAIASACERIYLPRTGGVGSVGVIAEHIDYSAYYKKEGVKVTQIKAGEHKDDLSSAKPLNDDGRARLQNMVDMTYEVFVEAVSKNRGLTEETVRNTEAQIYFGMEAVENGFADGLDSLDGVLNTMIQILNPAPQIIPGATIQEGNTMARLFSKKPKVKAETETTPKEEAPAPEKESAPEEVAAETEPEEAVTETEEESEDETERAAAIVEMAINAGVTSQAAELIRSGLTLEEVQEKIDVAKQIRGMCELAGFKDHAEDFIERNISVEDARKKLLTMKADKEEKTAVSAAPSPESEQESLKAAGNPLHKAVDGFTQIKR